MTTENVGYDAWLAAIDAGAAYYLDCENGHGSLPPGRVCPRCGSTDLEETDLPETGTVETFTVVHVGPPSFEDDAPYVTAVADFGPVRLTGQVRGANASEDVTVGETVSASVGESETTGERVLLFESR